MMVTEGECDFPVKDKSRVRYIYPMLSNIIFCKVKWGQMWLCLLGLVILSKVTLN